MSKVALDADAGPLDAHAPVLDGWHGFTADTPLGLDPIAPHLDLHGII